MDEYTLQVFEGSLKLRRKAVSEQVKGYENIIKLLISEVRRLREENERKDRQIKLLRDAEDKRLGVVKSY